MEKTCTVPRTPRMENRWSRMCEVSFSGTQTQREMCLEEVYQGAFKVHMYGGVKAIQLGKVKQLT